MHLFQVIARRFKVFASDLEKAVHYSIAHEVTPDKIVATLFTNLFPFSQLLGGPAQQYHWKNTSSTSGLFAKLDVGPEIIRMTFFFGRIMWLCLKSTSLGGWR